LYTYYLGIANYEQFQIDVSIDFLAMIIIGGLGSVLGSIFGAIFVTLLPVLIRTVMQSMGGMLMNENTLAAVIPNLRLTAFRIPIALFVIFEPGGLTRLGRIARNCFRFWPFSY